ncbi:MAG: hypothetical protein CMK54_06840, partial [Proteobacteria bacterium]|nr:hypothetical protein [Pseudomonadota bacterium]
MTNYTKTITLTSSGPVVTQNIEPGDTVTVTVEDNSSQSQNANNISLTLSGSGASINKSAVTSSGETFVITAGSQGHGTYNWSVGLSGSVKGQGNVSGTVNGSLSVDQIPNAYSFTNVTNSSVNAQHTEKAQITGINKASYVGPAPSGFELAIYTSGTPPSNFWRTTATNITNGQYLHVRGNAPSSVGQTNSGTFSVGTGAGGTLTSATWSISTVAGDSTPNGFSFSNLANQEPSTTFTQSRQITGINQTVTVTRGGDSSATFAVSSSSSVPSSSSFTVASKTMTNGQYVHFRMASSSSFSTSKTANISVGTVTSPNWTITTRAPDVTPTAFTFTNVSGVARNAPQNAYVQITGIEALVAATITGAGATFAVSNSTATPSSGFSTAGRNVSNNQYVHVRMTSSNSYNTTVTTTLTAGGVSDGWDVTTQAAPSTVDGFNAAQGGIAGTNSHGLSIKSSNGTEMFGVNLRNTAIQVFSTFSISANSSQTFACANANDSSKVLIVTKGISTSTTQS